MRQNISDLPTDKQENTEDYQKGFQTDSNVI